MCIVLPHSIAIVRHAQCGRIVRPHEVSHHSVTYDVTYALVSSRTPSLCPGDSRTFPMPFPIRKVRNEYLTKP